ncbi:hypothetical protein KCTC52924_02407 [Arenibacter antarcticus]|uniref:DUF4920 domain-containing protein n=1 Tax=Arenibacter antarcticus TaxID=2040469 RepID=A0ABW5VKF5_9FLAO|nr:DUF4920 domain-containing protein [Arenibacter sp. H213]MCM4168715.1 DUF4920 domain-containing protein [Arenibacter sp. H213]
MKYFNILIVFIVAFVGCKQGERSMVPLSETLTTVNFVQLGAQIESAGALDAAFMFEEYQKIDGNDSISTKFTTKVTDVCKAKGCWMKLQLGEDQEVMVKFKDYGFFMPKDIVGREVVVHGLAFVEKVSVEDQIHFAEDGGKSKEEIAKITDAKKTYSFVANGVLLKN